MLCIGGDKMKLEFSIEEEDYINFNIFHLDNSKTLKNSILFQRYGVPIIFLVVPFVLVKISNIPFSYWMTWFGMMFIVWVCFYKKYFIFKMKRLIRKKLKEGKNQGLLGKRIIEINESELTEITEYTKESVNIQGIENVVVNDKYIYAFINSSQAYIIPLRVFKDKDEQHEFIEYIKK